MKFLVTGFEPFGGEKENPAWEAVKLLPKELEGAEIVGIQVPTVFGRAGEVLEEAFEREKPDVVLCIGQAGGRAAITLERVAINLADAPVPDNVGQTPKDSPVIPGGPDGLFATIPVKAAAEAVKRAGLPAEISYSAGTYVCNDLMYRMLTMTGEVSGVRGGFIHVPFLPSQAAGKKICASMSLSDIVHSLETVITAIAAGESGTGNETYGRIC